MTRYTIGRGLASAVVILGILVVARIGYAQPANVQAAKKEGKVIVYGAVPPKTMDVINKPFEKKYGIKVEYWRGSSTKVMDRALTEWRAGRPGFDVTDGNRGVQLIMKEHGLFTKFIPVPSEKFPNQFKEKDALITPWRVLPLSILYNTELVKKSELPKSLQDLLDPKWKDKICMPDPSRHTTTAQFLANLDKLMGDKWLDYVKALANQNPHLVQSLAPVTNVIIRGEAPLGITYIKYVKQYKGPTDYVMLDKFLADANYLSLGAKAAHPNAGKLYIEYATSAVGQKAMAKEGEFVLYPGISPDIRDADKVADRIIIMDTPSEAEFKKLRANFQKIFMGK
jgi:iron(III) transport system substrate-binding protein